MRKPHYWLVTNIENMSSQNIILGNIKLQTTKDVKNGREVRKYNEHLHPPQPLFCIKNDDNTLIKLVKKLLNYKMNKLTGEMHIKKY